MPKMLMMREYLMTRAVCVYRTAKVKIRAKP